MSIEGDASLLEEYLTRLLLVNASYQDAKGRNTEAVYHAFFLGLLVHLEPKYEVRSNRESGKGLYDLMILPKEKHLPGVVLELKALDIQTSKSGKAKSERQVTKSVEKEMAIAIKQLQEKQYLTELEEREAHPIYQFAVIFAGKQAFVQKL